MLDTVYQAIQRNWQGYTRMVQQNAYKGVIAFQWKSWRCEYIFSDFGYK